jgi:diaminopimelate decarboxylase
MKATTPLDLRTTLAGLPVRDLADRFGTSTYVYDAATIVARIGDLKPFDAIRYAQKANSNLAILDLVRRHGVLVDAVSAGEIGRALAAGYRPDGLDELELAEGARPTRRGPVNS